jgi:hypothetical protein
VFPARAGRQSNAAEQPPARCHKSAHAIVSQLLEKAWTIGQDSIAWGGVSNDRNLMFQVLAAIIILLTTAIGWVAIALAARKAWKQHKQARRPS